MSPTYRWGNWSSERLGDWSMIYRAEERLKLSCGHAYVCSVASVMKSSYRTAKPKLLFLCPETYLIVLYIN